MTTVHRKSSTTKRTAVETIHPGGGAEQPLNRNQFIIFASLDGNGSHYVEALAGEGAPTPSGGYAKWAKIPRPQRVALTVLEGYDPYTLTVPILFDAVRQIDVQEDVENQIQWLEWMGGRGIKHTPNYTAGADKPPLLNVFSVVKQGVYSPLVPKQFQAPTAESTLSGSTRGDDPIIWFIEDIQWDEHPLRDSGGARIRQAATVKLVQWVIDPQTPPLGKAKGFTTYTITSGHRTLESIVRAHLKGSPTRLHEAVQATIKLNESNKKIGNNPKKKLALHTKIKVPNEFVKEA